MKKRRNKSGMLGTLMIGVSIYSSRIMILSHFIGKSYSVLFMVILDLFQASSSSVNRLH